MIKHLTATAAALLFTSSVMAEDFSYRFIEGGVFMDSETEKTDGEKSTEDTTIMRARGNFSFGPVFYLPVSIENAHSTFKDENCDSNGNNCFKSKGTSSSQTLMAGAGVHTGLGEHVSVYGEFGLLYSSSEFEYSSDDFSFDDKDTFNGKQYVAGVRFSPVDALEFGLGVRRLEWSYNGDYDNEDGLDHFYQKNLSAQYNFNEKMSLAINAIFFSEDFKFFHDRIWGAYFRYSF